MRMKKICAAVCAMFVIMTAIAACSSTKPSVNSNAANFTHTVSLKEDASQKPKYIFLFIGDGMSYPQIECTNYYLNALVNKTSMGSKDDKTILTKSDDMLGFLEFPVTGSAQTYSSTSYCPDSASAATAISTGYRTYSGRINMNENATKSYETIAEKLKKQFGYKIGIVSSVNLNHATPAAFYSHQKSRSSYYEIGRELVKSDFEYFAGGALRKPTGEKENKKDLYKLAEKSGYTVVKTQKEAKKVTPETGKVIIIDEHLADSDSMNYEIDRDDDEWALSSYVSKGIDCLSENNDKGFFMMVEGGKIDWACHANDAVTAMNDTRAFSDAVDEAVAFYQKHPGETLILVTGDHETGGMSIGSAGTNYNTYLQNLSKQKISFRKFYNKYVKKYKKKKTGFNRAMKDVTKLFGLVTEKDAGIKADDSVEMDSTDKHPAGAASKSLVLTDYELQKLKAAYKKTMTAKKDKKLTQKEYELYGSHDPFTVTIMHILNSKCGIGFTSYSHTGLPAAFFAMGAGQEKFEGYYDNTEIYKKMAELTGVR